MAVLAINWTSSSNWAICLLERLVKPEISPNSCGKWTQTAWRLCAPPLVNGHPGMMHRREGPPLIPCLSPPAPSLVRPASLASLWAAARASCTGVWATVVPRPVPLPEGAVMDPRPGGTLCGSPVRGRSPSPGSKCFSCGGKGHYRSVCPRSPTITFEDQIRCWGCGEGGHSRASCPQSRSRSTSPKGQGN